MPVWSYIDRGLKNTTYLGLSSRISASPPPLLACVLIWWNHPPGSFTGIDALEVLKAPTAGRSNEYQSRILSFVYTHDPNPKGMNLTDWPQYGTKGKMLEFNDQGASPKPVLDTFRREAIAYYMENIMGDGFKSNTTVAKEGNSTTPNNRTTPAENLTKNGTTKIEDPKPKKSPKPTDDPTPKDSSNSNENPSLQNGTNATENLGSKNATTDDNPSFSGPNTGSSPRNRSIPEPDISNGKEITPKFT